MNGIVKFHRVQQGSPEWLELRAMNTWNASEAPIIMGDHPKQSRDELMYAKATKTPKEFDSYVVNVVFEEGHDTEDAARKIISDRIHNELYRVTVTHQCEDYVLLASLDGATSPHEDTGLIIGFEHKQWAMPLVAYIEENGEPPPFIYWQLEHQLATVPAMEKILFVVSDGTEQNMVVLEYRAVPGRRARLIAGWKQWREDLKTYVPQMKEAKKVGIRPADLPVPTVEVSGELATQGNLEEFDRLFRQMVNSINTDLKTDQDFADADAAVKYLKDLRNRLAMSKKLALGKAVPLEEAFKIMDGLDELAQATAKNLADQIKTRKDNRKQEIANEAIRQVKAANDDAAAEFAQHGIDGLAWASMCPVRFDPYEHMKGLKSFDSMLAKVNAAVTKVRLDIGEARDKVRRNLTLLQASWKGVEFLFRDLKEMCAMDANILQVMIKQRIAEHQEKQREQETARINAHRQTLIKMQAAIENSDDQPVMLLRISRKSIVAIDPAGLEEFAAEGATLKAKALAHLDALIAKLEAEERQREQEAEQQRQAEVQRQLEANKQAEELQRKAVLAAQEESRVPIDIAAEAGFTETMPLQEALDTHQPATLDAGYRFVPHADSAVTIDMSQGTSFEVAMDEDTPLTADLSSDFMEPEVHAASTDEARVTQARPTNEAIIRHLMIYYAEDRETIIGWIRDMARTLG